jgi:hypothetical protein
VYCFPSNTVSCHICAVLVSQSVYSLDLIEYFLACVDTATQASETKSQLITVLVHGVRDWIIFIFMVQRHLRSVVSCARTSIEKTTIGL